MRKLDFLIKKKILHLINNEKFLHAALTMSVGSIFKLLVSLYFFFIVLKFGIAKQGVPLWMAVSEYLLSITLCLVIIFSKYHKARNRKERKELYKSKWKLNKIKKELEI